VSEERFVKIILAALWADLAVLWLWAWLARDFDRGPVMVFSLFTCAAVWLSWGAWRKLKEPRPIETSTNTTVTIFEIPKSN
jgi:predicted membrane metal-binding protein